MDHLFGSMAATSANRRSVLSARPDAPVVPDRPSRWRTTSVAVRRVGAQMLHRLADRLEPRPAPAPRQCSSVPG